VKYLIIALLLAVPATFVYWTLDKTSAKIEASISGVHPK
jgi:hypothetical protein